MSFLRDRLAALNVTTQSPDESVTVKLSRSAGITVELADDVVEIHTEESLEEEIEEALAAALDGYGQAIEMVREEKYGPQPPPDPNAPVSKRFEAFHAAGEALVVEAVSARNFVAVEWRGRGEFLVALRRKPLSKLDRRALESEINSAVARAGAEYSRRIRQLHKDIYQVSHFTPQGN